LDSAVVKELHDVLLGEVEEDFEVGLAGAGEAVAEEGETPGGADEDVAGIEWCFVNRSEQGGLGAEFVEEEFAPGKGGGEVECADGLSAGGSGEEESVGEVGDDARDVAFCGLVGIEVEEAADGSVSFEHDDLLE
jgi:hypothetical protein